MNEKGVVVETDLSAYVPEDMHPISEFAAKVVINDDEDNLHLDTEAVVRLKEELDALHDTPELKPAVRDILRLAAVYKRDFDFDLGSRALVEVAKTATHALIRQSGDKIGDEAEKKQGRLDKFLGRNSTKVAPGVAAGPKKGATADGVELKDLVPNRRVSGR
jgi:hypothetical protein